ncbi:hypothetical protein A1O3_02841 [Capronia epimyces CBS 606.96]|uniref:C2H2-type domain-containing protein n=1 Tax=Capronia epimyces CBS 606.96 TaxID=1182542 RepID=W9Z5J0_9EURO|nr:uncharacterized protein A1O3_02841 [Capronia epimyces CBS 606.96]EXJ89774.1 hypothetical protein A1O3_02841 [Capronia epimyces CBS 606.96]
MSEPKRLRLDESVAAPDMNQPSETDISASSEPRRRSSRTEPRRRFECTYPGCGRHYSRAEHLYRHQLNHNPKEIYKCDYAGCSRTFVRQDLCARHRERHGIRAKANSRWSGQNGPLSPRSSVSDEAAMDTGSPASNALQSPAFGRASFSAHSPLKPTDIQAIIQPSRPDSNGINSHVTSQSFAQPRRTASQQNLDPAFQASAPNGNYSLHKMQTDVSLSLQRSHSLSESVFGHTNPTVLNTTTTRSNGTIAPATAEQQAQENPATTYSIPSLGDQTFNDSPISIRDEFTAWLFEDAGGLHTAPFSMAGQGGIGFADPADSFGSAVYPSYFADPALENAYPVMTQPRSTESVRNIPELSGDSNLLSHAKRKSLITLMGSRFNEGDNSFVRQLREEVFQGNVDAEEHVLSIRSMRHYIGSYWYHFHAQMPILHQPTFSADAIHEYLLLAVMAIGASYLNKAHGRAVTDAAARLATFIAWHLRWQVFMHNDFHPPAKLWVFQTLLLLEIYEKTRANRLLHERSHIHYATTINLMRRGTALIETVSPDASRIPSTPDEWWSRWITAEATRRAAYAAFYLDAVHATMFGHASMMVVHEIRLPLPCDDALWSATSAAEVGRVEASLHANGIKPTTFLDGLKKTLTGRKVRTNNFGRIILMAGLLSVSWHMHQRDLQVSSLGVSQTMGVPDGWRTPLTKAFDFWKRDVDENIEHMRRAALPWQKNDSGRPGDRDMAETADVLHHLSHIAMHVDIMDCQIFAGTKRLFGRTVTNADYERVKCKVFDWAKGGSAKIGVWHALQLLRSVLLPGQDGSRKLYNARDDHLTVRPWTLYYAALVVWSYGFAMDGVLQPFPSLLQPAASPSAASVLSHSSNHSMLTMAHDGGEFPVEAVVKDAQAFLQTVGAVKTPQHLDSIKDGRNNVVGVLVILEAAFRDSRWELLHEGAELLRNAIMLLRGASRS